MSKVDQGKAREGLSGTLEDLAGGDSWGCCKTREAGQECMGGPGCFPLGGSMLDLSGQWAPRLKQIWGNTGL